MKQSILFGSALFAGSILLLTTLVDGSDAKISFELALATMRKAEVALVPRSECTKCNGTGKIKAGDTVTIVEVDCDACYPDAQEAAPLDFEIRIRTIKGCAPCISTKAARQFLIDNHGFAEDDFKIVNGGASAYPTIEVVIDGEIRQRSAGPQSSTQLSRLYNQWQAVAYADRDYANYGPDEWRAFCKKVELAAYTRGMSQEFHITNHHGKWKLNPDQIKGLSEAELIEIHGWQHTHKDIE